jgi:uncharacterized protein GlcG (DUF336 family)
MGSDVAIVDEGGHLLWLQRLDGAPPISAQIAPGQGLHGGPRARESKVYEDMINQGRVAFLSAPALQGMLEGGVPILVDGHCVGAVAAAASNRRKTRGIAQAAIAALGV